MSYSIKEIADKMNVTTETLRYWDNEELLPDVKGENITSIAPTLEVDKIPEKYKKEGK